MILLKTLCYTKQKRILFFLCTKKHCKYNNNYYLLTICSTIQNKQCVNKVGFMSKKRIRVLFALKHILLHSYIYLNSCIHVYTHAYTFTLIHILINSYIHLYTQTYTCTLIYKLLHSYIHSSSHMYIYLLIHIILRSYLHLFAHIDILTFSPALIHSVFINSTNASHYCHFTSVMKQCQ